MTHSPDPVLPTPTSRPAQRNSRALPIVLALVAPGLGHALVGRRAGALLWAIAPVPAALVAALVTSNARLAPALWSVAAAILGAHAASILDVARLRPATYQRAFVPGIVAACVLPLGWAPAVAIGIRWTMAEAFKIPAGSMAPTLVVGDHIFLDKRVHRAPDRGDAIVFQFPERPAVDFVKRVIAVAGDTLEVRAGVPWINGWKVPSCPVGSHRIVDAEDGSVHDGQIVVEFLGAHAYLVFFDGASFDPRAAQGPYVVKPGEVWVLGDNRHNSFDSRFWANGAGAGVPLGLVRGYPGLIWWSTAPGPSRAGIDLLGPPVAPPELAAALDACLAKRPSAADATPPSPKG